MSDVTAQASLTRSLIRSGRKHTPIASKDFFTISKKFFELCKQNIPTKMFIILIICECGILLLSLVFVDAETDSGKRLITKIQ